MSYTDKLFSIDGKKIVLTGASRGIGNAIAKALFQCGAKVIGCSRFKPEDVSYFDEYHTVDLEKEESINYFIRKVIENNSVIDCLINAGGITIPNVSENSETTIKNFDKTIAINLKASFLLIEGLKNNFNTKGGSIINISSIAQYTGFPNNPSYTASKGGLKQLTMAYANDLADKNIRVNNIAPGYIKTKMTEKSYNDPKLYKKRLQHTLLNRWGKPEDIVGGVIYLSSNASSYITGSTILIDGGWISKGMV